MGPGGGNAGDLALERVRAGSWLGHVTSATGLGTPVERAGVAEGAGEDEGDDSPPRPTNNTTAPSARAMTIGRIHTARHRMP